MNNVHATGLMRAIVLICLAGAGFAAAAQSTEGKLCTTDEDCLSKVCRPGPAVRPVTSASEGGQWYCTAPDRDCARPGEEGSKIGDQMWAKGSTVKCVNPADYGYPGYPPQFMVIAEDTAAAQAGEPSGAGCTLPGAANYDLTSSASAQESMREFEERTALRVAYEQCLKDDAALDDDQRQRLDRSMREQHYQEQRRVMFARDFYALPPNRRDPAQAPVTSYASAGNRATIGTTERNVSAELVCTKNSGFPMDLRVLWHSYNFPPDSRIPVVVQFPGRVPISTTMSVGARRGPNNSMEAMGIVMIEQSMFSDPFSNPKAELKLRMYGVEFQLPLYGNEYEFSSFCGFQ